MPSVTGCTCLTLVSTAVGVPQMPRITWANRSAVSWSRMITEASGPITPHRLLTASSSPGPILRKAMPWAWTPLVKLRSSVVSAVGMSSDAAPQEATRAAVVFERPSSAAWSFSQVTAQIAPRIRPGRTNGTSLRLAHGWSGATAGRYSTVTITHSAIISGSAQARAAPVGSSQLIRALVPRFASAARPRAPSSTVGTPRYQMTQ
jgi:hypothetical protein